MAVLLLAAVLIVEQSVSASTSFASVERFSAFASAKIIVFSHADRITAPARIIRGKVVDDKGEVLPGVSVQLKGTTVGAVTDAKGEYSISIPGDTGTLVFSFVGFTTVETIIGLGNTINTTMGMSEAALDEFVVVGYGTQRKIDVTGAVASVQAKELVKTTSPDVGRLLKGKLSGLMVIENSAQPGGGLKIQIRGAGSINASNDPLVVVDGFPIAPLDMPDNGGRYVSGSQSILNSFNPNDIESITVLKDASATAIYGSRAANGVILITTKPGVEGKPTIQYSANQATQVYADQFDTFSLKEWMAESNKANMESWDESNGVIPWGTKTRAQAEAAPVNGLMPQLRYTQADIDAAGAGTDWVKLITRNGSIQQHNLSVSGGSRSSRYYFSGNVFDNAGVVRNSDMKRYSFRMNLNQDLSQFVKLGLKVNGTRINTGNVQLGDDLYENSSLIKSAIDFSPAVNAIDPDGHYPLNPEQGLRPNPYSMLAITDKSNREEANVISSLDILPVKDLTVRLSASLARAINKRSIYQPKTTFFGNTENGIASVAQNDNNVTLYEGTANYVKTFAKNHNFVFLVGGSQQKFKTGNSSVGNTAFITDAFLWNNLGSGAGTRTVGSGFSDNMLLSTFGRINYSFKDRYLITGTVRRDGASVFSTNNKWATFLSGAVGWNMDNESWFEALKPTLNRFKLRLSYGSTGNSNIGSNAFAAYSAANAYLSGDDEIQTGVWLNRLENPDLRWETTTDVNLGTDFAFFNDKIEGSIEVYRRKTTDLLTLKPLQSFHAVNQVMANIGSTRQSGFEVSLTSFNMNKKDFQWKTTLAVSRYTNSWVDRNEGWLPKVYEQSTDPINAVYMQRADGIMQVGETAPAAQPLLRPGQIKIKDINGIKRDAAGNPVVDANNRQILTGLADGRIDEADFEMIGTRDPGLIAGLTNIITYKNLSVNFDFNGLFGRQLADPNFLSFGLTPSSVNNTLTTVRNRWTPSNPSTTHPSAFGSNYGRGDFFVKNASFVRLQNVELGYTLSRKTLGSLANAIQITAGASNLMKITGYKGVDPETDAYAAAYPNVRTYTIGLNATF